MILTTFSRVIQCEKFIKDESASLAVYASLYDLNMCILKTKGSKKEPVLRQIRKTTKKTTLWKWAKNVETYSSSNAAAQYPEERAN